MVLEKLLTIKHMLGLILIQWRANYQFQILKLMKILKIIEKVILYT